MHYVPIIGLEIHVQLKTKSKMFCSCDNAGEDKSPNTTVCPICMGHPGVLPVPNKQAIEYAVFAALSLNCKILDFSKFDRKNYFYPDLPKGYQISQFDQPIGVGGYLFIEVAKRHNNATERHGVNWRSNSVEMASTKIRITRVHLEEDAAKLLHGSSKFQNPKSKFQTSESEIRNIRVDSSLDPFAPNGTDPGPFGSHQASYVDFNRSSTPLLEIVTEPDIASPQEAKIFLQELRLIMRYLGISSADMEKGHLRCDANISLLPEGESKFNPKTEIKNLNSFKAVERALEYEIIRQTKLFEKGEPPARQSTRGWNEAKGVTEEQRTKEESHDYRYFPEPDIPPLNLIEFREMLKNKIPELPAAKRQRFQDEFGFSPPDAKILTDDIDVANYIEKVMSELYEWIKTQPEYTKDI